MNEQAEHGVLEEPLPKPSGEIQFDVKTAGRHIRLLASPLGIGTFEHDGLDDDAVVHATRVVERYLSEDEARRARLYLAAGRLRRQAGNPALAGTTHGSGAVLVEQPRQVSAGVMFEFAFMSARIRVLAFPHSGLIDDCDDWDLVSDRERDAAITAALDWIIDNPSGAQALGLDSELFREVWR